MACGDVIGISEFLLENPEMALVPSRDTSVVLEGVFRFTAAPKGKHGISDSYHIQINVPDVYPKAVPAVMETMRKIPRDGNHHVNPDDSLCMGSPLRLLQKINTRPSLMGFSETCLIPYLYGVSYKLQTGKDFPFGELPHGGKGVLEDYTELLSLRTAEQVRQALILLGMKERVANKAKCPCGCGRRLGKCSFRNILNKNRRLASRAWFRAHNASIRC